MNFAPPTIDFSAVFQGSIRASSSGEISCSSGSLPLRRLRWPRVATLTTSTGQVSKPDTSCSRRRSTKSWRATKETGIHANVPVANSTGEQRGERFPRRGREGDDHQPAGVLVDAMNDPRSQRIVCRRHRAMVEHRVDDRTAHVARRRMNHHACGLVAK